MHIKIDIDFELPGWAKKTLVFLGVPATILLGVSAVLYAGSVSVPHQFSPKESLSSDKMNKNFQSLATAIDALANKPNLYASQEDRVVVSDGQYVDVPGLGATFTTTDTGMVDVTARVDVTAQSVNDAGSTGSSDIGVRCIMKISLDDADLAFAVAEVHSPWTVVPGAATILGLGHAPVQAGTHTVKVQLKKSDGISSDLACVVGPPTYHLNGELRVRVN
jgi:hypothetical protein